jgi:O-antigen biosynthesis protein
MSPSLSVIVNTAAASPRQIRAAVCSVGRNRRHSAELIVVDASSPSHGGEAIRRATGEFFVLFDAGDRLAPSALSLIETAVTTGPDIDYAYGDEEVQPATSASIGEAFYKPDFSPERLRAHNYCGPLVIVRRTLLLDLIAEGASFAADQRYDLVLRITERARRIVHIAEILIERRATGAAATSSVESDRTALQAHLDRCGIDATIESQPGGTFRVVRAVTVEPKVSIIIPTRGSGGVVWGIDRVFVIEAVRSLIDKATYTNFEIVVVYDLSTAEDTLELLRRLAGDRLVLVPYDRSFNFSEKVNLGRLHADGDLLLLFNDDMEVISADFLEVMIPLAMEAGVGSVGAKLLLSDGRLQHGGHVYNGEPYHIMWGRWRADPGPFELLALQRECIGVTAACLMTRTAVFDAVGGFSTAFPIDFNDVDFALRLHVAGHRTIWTPFAELYHFETMTREKFSKPEAIQLMYDRWNHLLNHDPYYNRNLAPHRDDWVERGLR